MEQEMCDFMEKELLLRTNKSLATVDPLPGVNELNMD
ncbi:hypothetical protein T12_16647 [Trichinella patagoniensis]|uniref:Uncharacterized protein n=1 Tax=Trichinella patagoniensis TaxID=990121 RepID=A0A0V0Z0W9_9BILA|nr:hypothetical protein T12_16647 [Trichinella patagoniensis]